MLAIKGTLADHLNPTFIRIDICYNNQNEEINPIKVICNDLFKYLFTLSNNLRLGLQISEKRKTPSIYF